MTFRSPYGPNRGYGVGEDAEERLLDFTFDGSVKPAPGRNGARRARLAAIRSLIGSLESDARSAPELKRALVAMAVDIEAVMAHFQECAEQMPEQADYCALNLEVYGRARAILDEMYASLDVNDLESLVRSYADLESATSEVDALLPGRT